MNFVFISPQFPDTYWQWCAALKRNGANVLGIGDTPYDNISDELKGALTEYYWVSSLEDYDQVFRAVAFFSWRYGKIDWLESQNEYWLSQDARLRDDFHITTGPSSAQMAQWQSKAEMKPLYAAAGVPTARQIRATTLRAAQAFAKKVGYPLFTKPEKGVGAGGVKKIEDAADLKAFFADLPSEPYVIEEYITAELCSYEAILDSKGDPLFENQSEFQPSIAEVVEKELDVAYHACPDVDPKLAERGRATAKAFGITCRFVHMEFFRLTDERPGLGGPGDYVGLEVNVRAPGGFTPDLINYAHSSDVYQIWADMVCFDERRTPESDDTYFCCYVARRDGKEYVHSHEEVMERFGDKMALQRRVPDVLSDDLGNIMYVVRLKTEEERLEFENYVMERR